MLSVVFVDYCDFYFCHTFSSENFYSAISFQYFKKNVEEKRVNWTMRVKWQFEFFSLYSAPATQELDETVVTDAGSII